VLERRFACCEPERMPRRPTRQNVSLPAEAVVCAFYSLRPAKDEHEH
jgi:hypothetical protein